MGGSPVLPTMMHQRAADAIVAFLRREGAVSSTEVASRLGVSEMTALRRLRELVEQGAVERTGKGKNTRYRVGSK